MMVDAVGVVIAATLSSNSGDEAEYGEYHDGETIVRSTLHLAYQIS